MKYAYEDMSPEQFEKLIVVLCQYLLGMATQGFTKGPDGGRDAKFVGTAEHIPSKAAPWQGTTIIQAKHTNGTNKSFSNSDFYSSRSSNNTVIGKEIPRIKKLHQKKQLDNYMLFSNRRLTGNAESDICAFISEQCGISEGSIYLCGTEQLELFLKNFPNVPKMVKLDPVDSPLIISPDELAEVVEALARQIGEIKEMQDCPPTPRTSYDKKNALNKMSDDYATYLRKKFLKETKQISSFLANPENEQLKQLYESTIEEFQLKIIAKRKDYQTFDEIMNYLRCLLFNRDATLRGHKRLTRAMLFYMYWNCDIGKVNDA